MIRNISFPFLIQFLPNEPSIHPMQKNPRKSWTLDSMPWSPDSRHWILVFVSGTIRFCMLILRGIPDSLSCFLDFKAEDSEFRQQNFPRFQIPWAKTSLIPDSMGKNFPDSRIQILSHGQNP